MTELEQSAARRFGEVFKTTYTKAGFSAGEIGCQLGVSKSYVEKIKEGSRVPSVDVFGRFLQITEPVLQIGEDGGRIDSLALSYGILVENGHGGDHGAPPEALLEKRRKAKKPVPPQFIHHILVRQGVPITLKP